MVKPVEPVLMPKLVIGMSANKIKQKGFTLIEILVVILTVGITLGFALLAFGDFGSTRRITVAAEEFIDYVKLVQQQAIITSNTLSIRVSQDGYQALRLQQHLAHKPHWQPMSQTVFRLQKFPHDATVNLQKAKYLIVHPSGDMTAFTLIFKSAKQTPVVSVIGTHNGILRLQSMETS